MQYQMHISESNVLPKLINFYTLLETDKVLVIVKEVEVSHTHTNPNLMVMRR